MPGTPRRGPRSAPASRGPGHIWWAAHLETMPALVLGRDHSSSTTPAPSTGPRLLFGGWLRGGWAVASGPCPVLGGWWIRAARGAPPNRPCLT